MTMPLNYEQLEDLRKACKLLGSCSAYPYAEHAYKEYRTGFGARISYHHDFITKIKTVTYRLEIGGEAIWLLSICLIGYKQNRCTRLNVKANYSHFPSIANLTLKSAKLWNVAASELT